MRVLVYPHMLKIGGSPINAIDLAAEVRDHGHEVIVFGRPDALVDHIAARGLRFLPFEVPDRPRPSPGVIRRLRDLVREERIDLVHTYEFWPCVEAFYGAQVLAGVPVISTVLSMWVPPYLPRSVPIVVGTRKIQREARAAGRRVVELLEPPVHTGEDSPELDGRPFLRGAGLDDGGRNVVIVSRLTRHLKQEGLERVMDAVAQLDPALRTRLLVVGGGRAAPELAARAEEVNHRAGRRVVVMMGELLDPRPAYAAADVVVGMGSSALRGMAFAKPTVVVGELGFSQVVTPDTLHLFHDQGFYGLGEGDRDAAPLARQLQGLLEDGDRRRELGAFSRRAVVERYSVEAEGVVLEALYRRTVARGVPQRTRVADALGTGARVLAPKLGSRVPMIGPYLAPRLGDTVATD